MGFSAEECLLRKLALSAALAGVLDLKKGGRSRESADPLPPPSPSLSARYSSSTGSTTLHTSEPIASTSNAEDVPVSAESILLTTFERKLGLLKCNEYDAKMAGAPTEELLDGYCLINVLAMEKLIDALVCPKCHGGKLSLQERGTGADLLFVVGGLSSGYIVVAPHSPPIGMFQRNKLVMSPGVLVVLESSRLGTAHPGWGGCHLCSTWILSSWDPSKIKKPQVETLNAFFSVSHFGRNCDLNKGIIFDVLHMERLQDPLEL